MALDDSMKGWLLVGTIFARVASAMTTAIAVLLGLTLTSAAAFVLFAANLRAVTRGAKPFPKWALVPFATPAFAWRVGARALPIAFTLVLVAYALLQTFVQLGAFS